MTVPIEYYANGPVTTVASPGVDDFDTSLVVASDANFPGVGNFHIKVDGEIMLVTNVSGTAPSTWTVSRGVENTVARAHAIGTFVYCPLTQASLEALVVQMQNGAVVASRRRLNFIDTASAAWTFVDDPSNGKIDITIGVTGGGGGGGGGEAGQKPATAPPASSGFTWVNQGSATVSDDAGGIYLVAPAVGGNNSRALVKSVPGSPPWTFTVRALPFDFAGSSHVAGICLRESSTGKLIRFGFNAGYIILDKMNGPTSYSGNYTSVQTGGAYNAVSWFQITDDGTNLSYDVSVDGYNWFNLRTGSRTDFMTPDQYGLLVESNDGSHSAQIKYSSLHI